MFSQLPTLSKFLLWWWDGLRACLPTAILLFLFPRKVQLLLVERDGSLDPFRWDGLRLSPIGTQSEEDAEFSLLIPFENCIMRQVDIPASDAPNIDDYLARNSRQLISFNWEDVYAHFAIKRANPDSETVTVEVAAIPRRHVDPLRDCAKAGRREVNRLAILQGHKISFIKDWRPSRRHQMSPAALLAAGCAAVSILGAVYFQMALADQERQLQGIISELVDVKAAANEAKAAEDRLANLMQTLTFIPDKKAGEPSPLDILAAATRLLPQNSWLQELKWRDGKILLSGYSDRASDLVTIFENSEAFARASFTAPVAQDQRFQKERFNIVMSWEDAQVTSND